MKLPAQKIELLCADKHEVRYYLQGAYYDVENRTLTASNGHELLRVAVEPDDDDKSCIIPLDALIHARRLSGSVKRPNPVNIICDGKECVVTNGSISASYPAINGQFPDVDLIRPIDEITGIICIDAELLVKMQRALGANGLHLEFRGETGGVTIGGQDLAIVMPMRP